ncbi:TetR family transcriptional regulator [Pseudonocardia hierapolitana]|uniref:TetR family transcriptional regulator n=1 Tax=Pseudonocardia hierapolitana TaxID=1128676 RepID=A0A561SPG6_9PSEU|nr:TetR/AcrR family transcriptional regulator [Pseudonocardia hierapolitana]TWF76745.1 TetR family transcriptional regulator [Pseudonocardia hierapolitana]
MPGRKRLTARDWTSAALEALARGGVAAVAVEPIAASLGTTKGSFYWHFDSRDALLQAALLEWERTETDDVITLVETEPDVPRRLRMLLAVALGAGIERPASSVELALQPSADHPLVAPVLARITARRLDYLSRMFGELGFPPDEARQRSLLAYTAYLGHAQLAHATPDAAPTGAGIPAYIESVIDTLTAR